MKKYLSITVLSIALLPSCEGSDANKPSTRADRTASLCEKACDNDEDLCEEDGSTKASGKSCHERCEEQVEDSIKRLTPTGKDETDDALRERCLDATFTLLECAVELTCSEAAKVDENGMSVHCVSEEKTLVEKCTPDDSTENKDDE